MRPQVRYRLSLLCGLGLAILASCKWWQYVSSVENPREYSSTLVPFLIVICVPVIASLVATILLVKLTVHKVQFVDLIAGIANGFLAVLPGGLISIWGVQNAPVFGVSIYSGMAIRVGIFLWLVYLLLKWLRK